MAVNTLAHAATGAVVLAARETMNVARVGAGVGCGGVTPDERWLAAVWPFVRAWLPAPPAAVLEIGCGPLGGFVPMLRSAGFQATGVDPAVFGFLELDDRLDGLQVVGVARQDRLEVLQAFGGAELAEHELGEFCTAGGRADQVEFFGVPGRAVSRGHDAVEHDRVHDISGRGDAEAFPHCPQRDALTRPVGRR